MLTGRTQRSKETYRSAINSFMNYFEIKTSKEFQKITYAHVIVFKNYLQKIEQSPRSVNNRLSALSSLFTHWMEHQIVFTNPVLSVRKMKITADRIEAKVLTALEARKLLNTPNITKDQGMRDRAILGILFFTGCRVSELCNLKVKDFKEEQGFWILDFIIKGGTKNDLAVNQELQIFIKEYLERSGHSGEEDFPLILPIKKNPDLNQIRFITSRQIQRLWKRYTNISNIRGTTPHFARATFITQALENKCPLDDVQKSVGHSQIKTTQLYDKRGKKHRDSASFAVRY